MARPGFPRQRAVTLIEAVLFISVALGLIVGGIVFFQQASTSSRVSTQVRVLSSLVTEMRLLFKTTGWTPSRTGDPIGETIDDVLVTSGAVPARIIANPPIDLGGGSTTLLKTEWDTGLQITEVTLFHMLVPDGEYVFSIRLHDIPVEACARLATVDASGKTVFAEGAYTIRFSGNLPGGSAREVNSLPVTPAQAAANCSAVEGDVPGVDLVFWFDKAI